MSDYDYDHEPYQPDHDEYYPEPGHGEYPLDAHDLANMIGQPLLGSLYEFEPSAEPYEHGDDHKDGHYDEHDDERYDEGSEPTHEPTGYEPTEPEPVVTQRFESA